MNQIEERVRGTLRARADAAAPNADMAWERFAERLERADGRMPEPAGHRWRRLVTAIALVLSVGVVVVAVRALGPANAPSPGDERLSAFVSYMREFKLGDYEPAETPAALARQVDVVVTGTIEGVEEGQSYAESPGARPGVATSVLKVKVTEVVAGDAGLVHEGSVYIEIAHPAYVGIGLPDGPEVPFDHDAFAQTVPLGANGIFFLYDRTNEPYLETIINKGAGRPAGARLTQAFVQGFLIEAPDGRLVSVMEPFELMPPAWHDLDSIEDVKDALG